MENDKSTEELKKKDAEVLVLQEEFAKKMVERNVKAYILTMTPIFHQTTVNISSLDKLFIARRLDLDCNLQIEHELINTVNVGLK